MFINVRHCFKDHLYWLTISLCIDINHCTHFTDKVTETLRDWGLAQVQICSKWQGQNSNSGSLALEFVATHVSQNSVFYGRKTNKGLENTQRTTVRLILRLRVNEWFPQPLIPENFLPKKPMKTYPRTCSLHSVDLKISHNFLIPSPPKVFCVRFISVSLWLLLRVEERSWQHTEVKPQYSSLQEERLQIKLTLSHDREQAHKRSVSWE